MIESPLDPLALYEKLEKERAENDRLKEEIVYLKLEYDKLTDWAAEYKAENAKLNLEIEKFKGHLKAWDINE